MKKITTITPEQLAQFPAWIKKWVAVGLSTEPINFDEMRSVVLDCYKVAGLNPPKVLHMSSPFSCCIAGVMGLYLLKGVQAQVRAQVGAQVRAQVQDQVQAQVGAQVQAQVQAQVWVRVQDQVGSAYNNLWFGQFWANLVAWISFFRDVMGWENETLRKFVLLEKLCQAGFVWWSEDVCVICDRPLFINRDERGRLHSMTEPSIAYRDGWSLYHIHGVSVPEDIIRDRDTITVARIESEQNAEVRRVMIKLYGQSKFLMSGNVVIHSDDYGTLYRKEVAGDEPLVMCKVVNSTPESDGTYKDYFLRVPPTMLRAREAVAWTFGKTEEEYLLEQET